MVSEKIEIPPKILCVVGTFLKFWQRKLMQITLISRRRMFTFKVQKTLHSRNRDNKIEKMAPRGGWRPFCILHCFAHLFGQGDIIFVMEK